PRKKYTGIDIEPAYVAAAAAMSDRPGIRFTVGDVMTVTGSYDFAIVRLLLQHLADPGRALAALAGVIAPGGSILVIDAVDRHRAFDPPLPAFMHFFECYRDVERAAGRDRDVVSNLSAIAAQTAAWAVGEDREIVIPATFPGQLEIFRAVYSDVIDLFAPSV